MPLNQARSARSEEEAGVSDVDRVPRPGRRGRALLDRSGPQVPNGGHDIRQDDRNRTRQAAKLGARLRSGGDHGRLVAKQVAAGRPLHFRARRIVSCLRRAATRVTRLPGERAPIPLARQRRLRRGREEYQQGRNHPAHGPDSILPAPPHAMHLEQSAFHRRDHAAEMLPQENANRLRPEVTWAQLLRGRPPGASTRNKMLHPPALRRSGGVSKVVASAPIDFSTG